MTRLICFGQVGLVFHLPAPKYISEVNIIPTVLLIGLTTFLFSAAGIKIGNKFGARYKSGAEFAGGLILIVMGLLVLFEHTGIV